MRHVHQFNATYPGEVRLFGRGISWRWSPLLRYFCLEALIVEFNLHFTTPNGLAVQHSVFYAKSPEDEGRARNILGLTLSYGTSFAMGSIWFMGLCIVS